LRKKKIKSVQRKLCNFLQKFDKAQAQIAQRLKKIDEAQIA